MAYAERKQLITALEKVRGSRVLCYVLSDRETHPAKVPGFMTMLANEPQLLLVDQLHAIGKSEKIDLVLHTRGGATDAVWPFLSAIREHCAKLTVLVPFRAHSAGTMICLGADEVVLGESAELSPIDPTTGNQFNPSDPGNAAQKYGISVEDVGAYFSLADERAGLTQEVSKVEVFKELASKVHPLALGNVERVYRQIRRLARHLLALHLDDKHKQKIDEVVKALTQEFYSHVHAISRKEAIALLGPWVREPEKDEATLMWDLFNSYAETLELRTKFSLPDFMGDTVTRELSVTGAFLESAELSHAFSTRTICSQRSNFPPNVQVQVPAGGQIPLVPWAPRSYDFRVQSARWEVNTDGR